MGKLGFAGSNPARQPINNAHLKGENRLLFKTGGNVYQKQAICRSREDETIMGFRDVSEMPNWFQLQYLENQIWGVYYKENTLVSEDIFGDVKEVARE